MEMYSTILERTADSLSESYYNIGESLYVIYGDAYLLENDPVMCLVMIFSTLLRILSETRCLLTCRLRGLWVGPPLHYESRVGICGNVKSTHEGIGGIVDSI